MIHTDFGIPWWLDLYFEMNKLIDVTKELVVLETDFYIGKDDYKKGTDIVLLNTPFNDKTTTDEKEDDSFMNKTIELKIDNTIVDVLWLDNNSVKALKELDILLEVSFVTINRLENGYTEPTIKAKRKLFELCKENGIEVE